MIYLLFSFLLISQSLFSSVKYNHFYTTYLGGNHFEQSRNLCYDKEGNIIIVGGTSSQDFPTTEGAFMTEYNNNGSETIGSWGPMMAFVAKFSPNGELIFSTFLGGPNYDRIYGVEVDDDGFIYVGGRAGDDFPTTPGVVQEKFFNGNNAGKNALYGHQNGFISKLSPDGSKLIWSTYYGGDSRGFFRDIDIDDEGNVYGILNAVLETPPGINENSFDNTHNGGTHDMVVVKITNDGTNIEWATFIGGSGDDTGGPSIRVGKDKSVYVAGGTESKDLPVTPDAAQTKFGGVQDMYVARFAPDGKSLIYCTYIGGSDIEVTETHGLNIDNNGYAYIACGTKSDDNFTTENAFKKTNTKGVNDCLLVKLSLDGTQFLASSYFGGTNGEHPEGLSIDNEGNLYFGGETVSTDLPTTMDAPFPNFLGETDAYIVKMNNDFSEVEFCTYFGGNDRDAVRAFDINSDGMIAISGQSNSNNLPTNDNSFQKNHILPKNRPNTYLSLFKIDENSNVINNSYEEIKVFPNPSSKNINLDNSFSGLNYNIYNNKGIKLIEGVFKNNINIENLPKGNYFLKFENQNNIFKFIKE